MAKPKPNQVIGLLRRDLFAIREHRKFVSASMSYEILDARGGKVIGSARENLGPLTKLLRWLVRKDILPTTVEVFENAGQAPLFTIRRGLSLLGSTFVVRDAQGQLLATFRNKSFSSSFQVSDNRGAHYANLEGGLAMMDFQLTKPDGKRLGRVSKEFREVVNAVVPLSADKYAAEMNPELSGDLLAKTLLLAATFIVDATFHSEPGE